MLFPERGDCIMTDIDEKKTEIEKSAKTDNEIDYPDISKPVGEQLSEIRPRYQVNREFYRPIKKATTIRLDADSLDYLQHSGAGWQTRINEYIRKGIESGEL